MTRQLDNYEQIDLFNNSVSKLNNLVEARYKLSAPEQKIILLLASMVQPGDADFKMYKFRLVELISLLGLQSKGSYQTIENTVTNLMSQVFEVRMPDSNKWVKYSWVIKSAYDGEEGCIYMQLHPDLKLFFLNLKRTFTTYKLFNILELKSGYSIRMYELLKQYEPIGERTMTVSELRYSLGVNKELTKYSNFKRVCILKAQEELKEKTDISFDFKEIKKGRSIDKLIFTINSENTRYNIIKHAFNFAELYPSEKQLKQLEVALKNISDEDLIPICIQLKTAFTQGFVKEPIALLLKYPDKVAMAVKEGSFYNKANPKPAKKENKYEIYVPPNYINL